MLALPAREEALEVHSGTVDGEHLALPEPRLPLESHNRRTRWPRPPGRPPHRKNDDLLLLLAARRLRRRRAGGGGSALRAVAIVVLLLGFAIVVGAAVAAGRAVQRGASRLLPRRAGGDAEAHHVARLRAQRLLPRCDPGHAPSAAGLVPRDVAVDPEGDGRRRGPHVLEERRARLQEHRASGARRPLRGTRRAGRLDDHAAARPQPLPGRRQDPGAQAPRGVSRPEDDEALHEAGDPRRLPQPDPVRPPRTRDRGGRAHVLRRRGLEARAGPGRVPRRPPAGAFGVRPDGSSASCAHAAERGAARDARRRLALPCPLPPTRPPPARAPSRSPVPGPAHAELLLVRRVAARPDLRPRRGVGTGGCACTRPSTRGRRRSR